MYDIARHWTAWNRDAIVLSDASKVLKVIGYGRLGAFLQALSVICLSKALVTSAHAKPFISENIRESRALVESQLGPDGRRFMGRLLSPKCAKP
jgi:hypothetical protein